MSHFNLLDAVQANATLTKQRQANNRNGSTYIMYYSNDGRNLGGRITGSTIKQLIGEFRRTYGTYNYAFVVKQGAEDTILRSYNVNNGKKFISHTRKGGKRKAK